MDEESVLFEGIISNDFGANDGDYPLLVRAVSSEPDPNLGFLDAWDVLRVEIGGQRWARTWGSNDPDSALAVCAGDDDKIYVTGLFSSGTDFDPGPGVVSAPEGNYSSRGYVSGFNLSGDFENVVMTNAKCAKIDVDGLGNVLVSGRLYGTVDFDPGPGTYYLSSISSYYNDIFLWKIDPDFNLIWADSWQTASSYSDGLWDIVTDNFGNSYVAARFTDQMDFDKGPGTDIREGPGMFIISYDPSGSIAWRIILESSNINPRSIAYGIMGSNEVVVIGGNFRGTVDFDPGPNEFYLSTGDPDNSQNAFYCVYTREGDFLTAVSWGAEDEVEDVGCLSIDALGNIWVVGNFSESVDFDPGPGFDEHTSNGGSDFYLSKFDSGFNYQFCKTWGSVESEKIGGMKVVTDSSGSSFVSGNFEEAIDLDPGPGTEFYIPSGEVHLTAFYVSKFDPMGNFMNAAVFTGWNSNYCKDLDLDPSGISYLAGSYWGILDLNPGDGFDFHESFGQDDAFLINVGPDSSW
jgi:hypothetical protein